LLLADEPTGNLDTASSLEIMEILEGLNRDWITVILVTHEVDIAAHAAREIVIKDGQVLSDRPIHNRAYS
jgi:putative ABC transport system ATP-binding protein